jgi:hypothetical protein
MLQSTCHEQLAVLGQNILSTSEKKVEQYFRISAVKNNLVCVKREKLSCFWILDWQAMLCNYFEAG